jgi:uncharacterized protein involved in outer membrane biogenesis
VGDPLGLALPTTGPFQTRGFLAKDGDLWKAVFEEAQLGQSHLRGAFTFDRRPAVPLLAGRLSGSRVLLQDLGPSVGAEPRASRAAAAKPKRGKVLPDRQFDLPTLRAMEANILVDIAHLDLGTALLEPIRPLRGHLRLRDAVLTLSDLDARTAEGRITGMLQLDGRKPVAGWDADIRLVGVRLERWLRQSRGNNAPPYVSGMLDGQVKVTGKGRSTAEILGSLDGGIRFHMRDATLSHLIVEVVGLDAAQAFGVFIKGDASLRIQCNIFDLGVEKGVVKPRVLIIDTRDSTVLVDGTLSLQTEALDLTAIVSPKDFSPLTLRSPIHIKGPLSSPSVSLDKGRIAGKVGAAAVLALVNPIAALLPFIDTGSSEEAKRQAAECASLTKRGNLATVPKATKSKAR